MANAKIKGGELTIDVESLLTPELCRALVKHAVFDAAAIEGIGRMLVKGEVDYHDSDDSMPWWHTWTGKGSPYEKARRVFLGLANRVTQKLIEDLTEERDRLFKQREDLQQTVFMHERVIRDLQNENELVHRHNRECYAEVNR